MASALVRVAVVAMSAWAGVCADAVLALPGREGWLAAAGAAVGLLAVWLEWRARAVALDRLVWGTAGGALGLGVGLGLGSAIEPLVPGAGGVVRGLLGLALAYLGLAVALARREALAGVSARLFPGLPAHGEAVAILDTSAIIDGRIAEVCAAGFLGGPLLVPRFVVRELQQIADSPDILRRTRGKRGFDVLQRLQQLPGARVRLDDRDVPGERDVDQKLVELARATGGRLVTTDSNLAKVAELSGIAALNVNDLASALRPAALPGETLHLHVVREGKEAGQGVGYLDDGTMVVVDHGRKLIGQVVDVTVTSVLQTPAGRMIFARIAPVAAATPPSGPAPEASSPGAAPGPPSAPSAQARAGR